MSSSVKVHMQAAQDTRNPVLDSLVNLLAGTNPSTETLIEYHAVLLDLASKEPGGLKRYLGQVK